MDDAEKKELTDLLMTRYKTAIEALDDLAKAVERGAKDMQLFFTEFATQFEELGITVQPLALEMRPTPDGNALMVTSNDGFNRRINLEDTLHIPRMCNLTFKE